MNEICCLSFCVYLVQCVADRDGGLIYMLCYEQKGTALFANNSQVVGC